MASGGGGSQQSSSRPDNILSASPIVGVLANLFGVPTVTNNGGIGLAPGFSSSEFTDPGVLGSLVEGHPGAAPKPAQFSGAAFGPGSGFENVGGLLTEQNIFADLIPLLGGASAAGVGGALGNINQALSSLQGAMDPVDVDPLVQQALSDVREQYSPNYGAFSSDLDAEGLRTASQLRVGAAESAAERSAGLGSVIGSLSGLGATLPADVGGNLLQTGELFNLSSSTPQGRAAMTLQMLAGIQPTGMAERGAITQSSGKNAEMGIGG